MKALELYNIAIELDPEKVMELYGIFLNSFSQDAYIANRANIYLKMEKWEEAERDASRSIEMGNACSQKHDRRGQARCNLGNYIGALEDFTQAKEFDQ